jgi:hypothetical protein
MTAAVELPANLSEGLNRIQIRITDHLRREITFDDAIFISNQVPQTISEPVVDEDGVERMVQRQVMPTTQFIFDWARRNLHDDGRIIISDQTEVLLGVSTIPVRSVTVTGTGVTNVEATVDQFGRVIVKPLQAGDIGPLTLRLQTDDGIQQSTPFRILADFGPVVNLQGFTQNSWVRASVPVRFNVSSRSRVTAVEYSLDMGSNWISFGAITADYNRTLDISGLSDGLISVLIRATNEAGQSNTTYFSVIKDTEAPVAKVVMPIEDAVVNGTIRMAFSIEEMGKLQSVTYRRPAAAGLREITMEVFNADTWDKDYNPRFLEVLMDAVEMPLAANMRFTFTDKAGNSSEVTAWPFLIDPESDIPVVHIILPFEDEVITSDFVVSGVMYDDDGIKNLQWRLNNNPWQVLEATDGFSIPIPIAALTDNEHTISVFAEDIYGVRSQPVTRRIRVSLSEPSATITYPLIATVLRHGVEIRGTAADRNGLKEVLVSLDNGNTWNNASGSFGTPAQTVNWTYQFDTRILQDGPNVMFVQVVDRYDITATYATMLNIDNTPPEIILESPAD